MAGLPKATRLEIEPVYMLLLIGPTFVFLGTQVFLAQYGDVDFVFPGIELATDAAPKELVGRYKYYAALFFYGAVSVAVGLYFAVDTGARHTRRSLLFIVAGVLFIFALALGFAVVKPRSIGGLANWDLLGLNVFLSTLGQSHVSICADGGALPDCVKKDAFSAMKELLSVIDMLAAFGASGAILGTILTLSRPMPRPDVKTEEGLALAARALHGAKEASKRYVYCSGLMLTSGMTVLIAWMNWPAAMIADTAVRTAYIELVGSVSLMIGVSYSLLILSYYMPVTLILAIRIYDLRHAPRDRKASADEAALKIPALPEIGQLDGLKTVIAILSPIMASAIGSFGNALMLE